MARRLVTIALALTAGAGAMAVVPQAFADPCEVDLQIYDGQKGAMLPDDTEETRGAFTVLNRNDSNKDNTEDLGQQEVVGEIDLMKLVLTASDAEIGALGVSGINKVKLWSSATKTSEVAPDEVGGATWTFDGFPQELWVEGIEVSAAVRDVSFSFEAGHKHPQPEGPPPTPVPCGNDSATATIVWAELTEVKHDKGDDKWEDFTAPPTGAFKNRCGSGFGLRPVDNKPRGVANCIGMQFTVSPKDVWMEPGVKFDVTRQRQQRWWVLDKDDKKFRLDSKIEFPKGDIPNDDLDDGEEVDSSKVPTADGHFYSFDGPGPKDDDVTVIIEEVQRWNMREFVRVRFDNQVFHGNLADGSRCSPKFDWHATHWLERKPRKGNEGKWVRTTGDASEKMSKNDVGFGHLADIGEDPKLRD